MKRRVLPPAIPLSFACVAGFALLLAAPPRAEAVQIRYDIAGVLLDAIGSTPAGTPVTASLRYDTAAAPSAVYANCCDPSGISRKDYPLLAFQVTVGSETLSPTGLGEVLQVRNDWDDTADNSGDYDLFGWGAFQSGSVGGVNIVGAAIFLYDFGLTALSSTDLPDASLTLTDFPNLPPISFNIYDEIGFSNVVRLDSLSGHVVPEPSALLLLAMGLLAPAARHSVRAAMRR